MPYDPPAGPKNKATDKDIDAVLALPLKKKGDGGPKDDEGLSLEEAQAAEKEAYSTFADTLKAGDPDAGVEAFHKLLDACQKVDDLGGYEEPEAGSEKEP